MNSLILLLVSSVQALVFVPQATPAVEGGARALAKDTSPAATGAPVFEGNVALAAASQSANICGFVDGNAIE
jgi:hypothetical protein